MKFRLHRRRCDPQHFVLHLDVPLPDLNFRRRPPFFRPINLLCATPRDRYEMAVYLARRNRGKSRFELAQPLAAFTEFLDSLFQIDGLTRAVPQDRYALALRIAVLFDPLQVANRVAQLIVTFYPDEQLTMLPEIEEVACPDHNSRPPFGDVW